MTVPADAATPRSSVWHNRNYVRLWTGESVSLFGSYITQLAMPLTAILALHATALDVSYLNAARFAPALIIPLLAGVWVDRRRRKPLLLAARVGCALTLGVVPAARAAGVLDIPLMCAVACLLSALVIVDQIAYQAFVPSVVGQDQLVQANSGFMGSGSVASLAGPGAGGLLVSLITAPATLLVDAASYIFCSLTLLLVSVGEQAPVPRPGNVRIFSRILTGMRLISANRVLASLAGWSGTYNFFNSAAFTLVLLFMTSVLQIGAGEVGVVFSLGGVGALLGAVVARWVGDRIGIGWTLVMAMFLAGAPWLLAGLAHGMIVGAAVVGAVLFVEGLGVTIANIHSISLRQGVIPPDLLGTVMGGMRFINSGPAVFGSLLGGVLGTVLGFRLGLLTCGIGMVAACAWPLACRLSSIRSTDDVTLGPVVPAAIP